MRHTTERKHKKKNKKTHRIHIYCPVLLIESWSPIVTREFGEKFYSPIHQKTIKDQVTQLLFTGYQSREVRGSWLEAQGLYGCYERDTLSGRRSSGWSIGMFLFTDGHS